MVNHYVFAARNKAYAHIQPTNTMYKYVNTFISYSKCGAITATDRHHFYSNDDYAIFANYLPGYLPVARCLLFVLALVLLSTCEYFNNMSECYTSFHVSHK